VAATDHAVRFIRESGESPFYLNLWLHETHHVVSATKQDREPYPDTPEPQQTYFAAVTRADRQVGRILKVLAEQGIENQTLVIFSSDNGPENTSNRLKYSVGSTGGMKGRKRSLYMGGVCVPFIVRWPGRVPAGRIDKETPLAAVDIFPTFLAIAGIRPPANYQSDGECILPALLGEPWQRTKPLFWFWQGHHGGADWPVFSMRNGRWGLVMDEQGKRVELYDLINDRNQEMNLLDREMDRAKNMQAAIRKWSETLPNLAASLRVQHIRRQPAKKRNGPQVDRNAVFDKKDLNGDGRLTLEEYLHRFPDQDEGRRRFPGFDKNGDGLLSREEFVK
jgi:N-acetylgalactosamine-6-sulfatase